MKLKKMRGLVAGLSKVIAGHNHAVADGDENAVKAIVGYLEGYKDAMANVPGIEDVKLQYDGPRVSYATIHTKKGMCVIECTKMPTHEEEDGSDVVDTNEEAPKEEEE